MSDAAGNNERMAFLYNGRKLAAFSAGNTSLMFVTVHLYFGDNRPKSIARRSLETYAVAKWSDQRQRSRFSFTRELAALGDFNMPKSKPPMWVQLSIQ